MSETEDEAARLRALEEENAALRRQLAEAGTPDRQTLRTMLHELRQPVQAAKLFHGLLARSIREGEDGDRVRRMGEALQAIEERLNDMQWVVRGGGPEQRG